MVRRPRCRSCQRRIWPWQVSVGWGAVGAPDNDPWLSFMRHGECVERELGMRKVTSG